MTTRLDCIAARPCSRRLCLAGCTPHTTGATAGRRQVQQDHPLDRGRRSRARPISSRRSSTTGRRSTSRYAEPGHDRQGGAGRPQGEGRPPLQDARRQRHRDRRHRPLAHRSDARRRLWQLRRADTDDVEGARWCGRRRGPMCATCSTAWTPRSSTTPTCASPRRPMRRGARRRT